MNTTFSFIIQRVFLFVSGVIRQACLSRSSTVEIDYGAVEIDHQFNENVPNEPRHSLAPVNKSSLINRCAALCEYIHNNVTIELEKEALTGKRFISITPATFLNFIATVVNILCRCKIIVAMVRF